MSAVLSQHTLLLVQEFNSTQRILEYVWWIASSLSYLLHDVLDTVLCELEVFSQLLPVIVDLVNHFDTQFCEIIYSHLVTVSYKFNN